MKIHCNTYAAQKPYPGIGLMRWTIKGKRTWKIGGIWIRGFGRGVMIYNEGSK